MEIITKQIKIEKTFSNDEIERKLSLHGEPLRWAIVDIIENSLIIEAVFIKY